MTYRQLDHTADLALEVTAEDEMELLAEAARALVEVMTDSALTSDAEERAIEIDALDREDRLVQFLNEVIFLAVQHGFLVHSATLTPIGETRLFGVLRGSSGVVTAELKSATYHGLELESRDGRWRAVVVVDV